MLLLHIGAFQLAVASQKTTLWHALLPRTRLLCAIALVFAIALTPNGRWVTWAVYGAIIGGVILLSRVPWRTLLTRVAVETLFVGAVLLGTLFRDGGEVVWSWGILRVTTEGITVLGSVGIKMLLSLLVLNVLTLTTSIADLLQALVVLRTPPIVLAILTSMLRYLQVSVREFQTMQRAAASRNLTANPRTARLVLGNAIGSLFIRTYTRGERISQAMLSRGYTGIPPAEKASRLQRRDFVAIASTVAIVIIGQGIR
ncbi:MAG TPA: cobalt ECF transporter T component CbiQ [Oscillatoriales cyanobacterium M59_W2019_021]|nr:cobalt ECF transporter T component CbiQ [Oscillatoriales cyanobacterium M4454_W2019_049]HIK51090.1 cobalt ECF transporter T component CbiQ [Oscillatoriales cyanobacterium M59_W2019_021]